MMTDPQDLKRAARIFKSLSHPGRLQIACLLGSGRYATQRDLISKLGWPQSTVARHVGALRSGGLVTAHRCGTEVHLELVEPVAHELMNAVCDWVHPETGEHFNHRLSDLAGVASYAAWESEVRTAAEPAGQTLAERERIERQNQISAYFTGAAVQTTSAEAPPPLMPMGGGTKKKAGGC